MNSASWDTIKLTEMDFVLRNKLNSCNKFRQSLVCTEGVIIAEATQDQLLGVGIDQSLAQFTRPSRFLGKNQLRHALMSIRNYFSILLCEILHPYFENIMFHVFDYPLLYLFLLYLLKVYYNYLSVWLTWPTLHVRMPLH